MGASVSQNISTMLSNVSNNVTSTTTVNQTANNNCEQNQSISGCDIKGGGNVTIANTCNTINTVAQMGSVSNNTQLSNDIAQSLTQEATSSTGFLGIGVASAINSSFTSSSIANTVSNVSKTNMEKLNSVSQNQSISDCSIEASGDITMGNTSDLEMDGSQSGTVENYSDIANTVSQTADQTATATVSGLDLGLAGVVVAVVVVLIVANALRKKGGSSAQVSGGLRGGAVSTALVWNTIGMTVLGGSLLGLGFSNLKSEVPCNNNAQCDTDLWYAPSFGCTCTDHLTCGIDEPNHNPLSNVGLPLLLIAPMEDNTSVEATAYLRKMAARSICGFDASNPAANNSGFNIGNYISLREEALSSSNSTVKSIFDALFEFMNLHCGAQLDSSNGVVIIDPSFEGSDPSKYVSPCPQELVEVLLPMVPVYAPEYYKEQAAAGCTTVASYISSCTYDSSVPSTASTLLRGVQGGRQGTGKVRTFFRNLLQKFRDRVQSVRLVDPEPEPDPSDFYGTVNVGQRLCFKESTDSDSGVTTTNFSRMKADGSCEDKYAPIWSPNSMASAVLCTVDDSIGGSSGAKSSIGSGGIYLNDSSKIDTACNPHVGLMFGGVCPSLWTRQDSLDINTCNPTTKQYTLNSTIASTFGSNGTNNAGPYKAIVGLNWWPEQTGSSDDRVQKMDDVEGWSLTDGKLSSFTQMYKSGDDKTRIAINGDALKDLNSMTFEACKAGSDGTYAKSVEGYDANNTMAVRMGIAVEQRTAVRPAQFCQTFGSVVNGNNKSTRFFAEMPLAPDATTGNGMETTQSLMGEIYPNTDIDIENVGTTAGDDFCRIGMGFDDHPNAYPFMTTIQNKKYQDSQVQMQAATATLENEYTLAYGSGGGSAVLEKYVPQLLNDRRKYNTGYFPPAGGCKVFRDTAAEYPQRVCSVGHPNNCWNPALCRAVGAQWIVDNPDVNSSACADTTSVNTSSADEDCYPGRCVDYDNICSADMCSACLTSKDCTDMSGCKYDDSTSTCIPGCSPNRGQCEDCTTGECVAPCVYDEERDTCTYGPALCAGAADKACCPDSEDDVPPTEYLVKIPNSFTNQGVSSSDTNVLNCSPNIFIPVFDASAEGFDETGVNNSSNMRICQAGSTSFSQPPFEVDCSVSGSNCYSSSSDVDPETECPAGNFQFLQIVGSAGCFFGTKGGAGFKNSSSEDPHGYAAMPTKEQNEWQAANSASVNQDGRALWYMCNRVFSWVLMLSQSAKKRTYMTSILGLSTLLNDNGMNEDTNEPYIKLESVDDLEDQINDNPWAKIQPLLFKLDDGSFKFATLEDIHLGKVANWWSDSYIRQINQFIYDEDNGFPSSVVEFADKGMGTMSGSLDTLTSEMDEYKGTLVGSTGSCNTLWNSKILNYTSMGIGSAVFVALLAMWIQQLRKK
jgi:hypothetical protein